MISPAETNIYIDTSVLLAILDRSDPDHERAVAEISKLDGTTTSLVTTSYVLVEAGALVRSRLGVRALRELGSLVERAFRVIWVDEALHRKAWEASCKEGRQGASLVDWVGFLTMEELGIRTALALDKHFVKRGFRTLP